MKRFFHIIMLTLCIALLTGCKPADADDTQPQTIIGYDEDGAKVFRLFPEGADAEVEAWLE